MIVKENNEKSKAFVFTIFPIILVPVIFISTVFAILVLSLLDYIFLGFFSEHIQLYVILCFIIAVSLTILAGFYIWKRIAKEGLLGNSIFQNSRKKPPLK